ncbi:MAG: HD domain-containing phosphohydrolase [Candidatus Marinarcus sp.]|uniref:HD domain-containing phosphohydrolase n=1 Tax=Candidatus Marinarcus sp. TaxID=3100987 RepID=UPI003AFF7D20
MKLSLKTLLIISFSFVIVISMSTITIMSYYSTKANMAEQSFKIMQNISDFAVDKSKTYMNVATDASFLTKNLENKNVLNVNNQKNLINYFYEQMAINQYFSAIYYASKDGNFLMLLKDDKGYLKKDITIDKKGKRVVKILHHDKDLNFINEETLDKDTYDARLRPWYINAVEHKKSTWTEPYVFYTSKKTGITISTPLYDKNHALLGVIGIDIEIERLSTFINNLKLGDNGKVFLINSSLKIISLPSEKNEIRTMESLNENSVIKLAYNELKKLTDVKSIKKKFFLTFKKDDNYYQAMFLPFNIGDLEWTVGMYVLEDDFLGILKNNNFFNILFIIVIGFISLFISLKISNYISSPILKLRDMTKEMELLNLNQSDVNPNPIKEINELIASFNHMKINLKESYVDTLFRLAVASEYKDTDTAEHINRIGLYSQAIAQKLCLNKNDIYILKHASAMHDIGKLGIPDRVLLKPGKLNEEERKIIETHPEIGAAILKNPTSEIMKMGRDISLYHHEKWDGTGYPKGLKGDAIPLFARIVSIVDVFDALMSKRCYKEAFDETKSKEIILEGKGTFFDPKIVEAFEKCFKELVKISKENS